MNECKKHAWLLGHSSAGQPYLNCHLCGAITGITPVEIKGKNIQDVRSFLGKKDDDEIVSTVHTRQ